MQPFPAPNTYAKGQPITQTHSQTYSQCAQPHERQAKGRPFSQHETIRQNRATAQAFLVPPDSYTQGKPIAQPHSRRNSLPKDQDQALSLSQREMHSQNHQQRSCPVDRQPGRMTYKVSQSGSPFDRKRSEAENQKIKRSLRRMKRSELIDIIEEMQNPQARPVSHEAVLEEKQHLNDKATYHKAMRTTISVLLVVAAVAVLLSALFFPVLQVTGHSMYPVLEEGDVVLVWKDHHLERGELCTFYYQNKLLIKRVIGLPGDEIYIDKEGTVFVNGQAIEEDYVKDKALGNGDVKFPYQVPDNRFFVLGDHRTDSVDSRHEQIGTVGMDELIGRIVLRIWPLERLSRVN